MHEPDASPEATSGAATDRVRLARLALDSALAEAGVAGPDAGPLGLRVTQGGEERVPGITAAVTPDGRYELSIHLIGRLGPLQPLAESIRTATQEAARGAGLGERLGPVNIRWEDVAEPGEFVPPPEPPPGAAVPPPPGAATPRSAKAAAAGSGAPPPAPGSPPPGAPPPPGTPARGAAR